MPYFLLFDVFKQRKGQIIIKLNVLCPMKALIVFQEYSQLLYLQRFQEVMIRKWGDKEPFKCHATIFKLTWVELKISSAIIPNLHENKLIDLPYIKVR